MEAVKSNKWDATDAIMLKWMEWFNPEEYILLKLELLDKVDDG